MSGTITSEIWVTVTVSGGSVLTSASRHKAQQTTPTPSPTTAQASTPSQSSAYTPVPDGQGQVPWNKIDHGVQGAIVFFSVVGIVAIVAVSVWFCCDGCGLRSKRRRARNARREVGGDSNVNGNANSSRNASANANANGAALPLQPLSRSGQAQAATAGLQQHLAGDMPPPSYEESLPPRHQHIAGGIVTARSRTTESSEEDDAMVSDGKTPLSEIPFEDVVLEDGGSGSSSSSASGSGSQTRHFELTHHAMGGDTTGHTNS